MAGQQSLSQRYELLGRLLLRPFDRTLASQLSVGLQKALASLPQKSSAAETDDERAALHHSIFGFEIQPYAGAYLHPQGLVGGEQTEKAILLCTQLGIHIDPTADTIEHLGRQLQILSMLSEDEDHQQQVLALLDGLLLTWLPVVLIAIQRYGQPFYSALSQEIWQLVGEHRKGFLKPIGMKLPDKESLLSDPKTGLKQVARYLVTPLRSGCYLSRAGIGEIARNLSLPRGFGTRYQMLESLLFTAVDQEAIPQLMEGIECELNCWMEQYCELAEQVAFLAPILEPWKLRTGFTMELLREMKGALQS